MPKIKTSKSDYKKALLHLAESNQHEVGDLLREQIKKGLGKWERRVVSLLARSKAYRENDLDRLLELANDIKTAHAAQIQFVEKYVGDIFSPIAMKSLKMELVETDYIDREILPFLAKFADKDSSS